MDHFVSFCFWIKNDELHLFVLFYLVRFSVKNVLHWSQLQFVRSHEPFQEQDVGLMRDSHLRCSDKTGTLTTGQMTLTDTVPPPLNIPYHTLSSTSAF